MGAVFFYLFTPAINKIRRDSVLDEKKRLIAAAAGRIEPDLVLKNAFVVNVFTEELEQADVAICDGMSRIHGRAYAY